MPKVRTGSASNVDLLDVEQTRSVPMRHSRTESIPRAKVDSILAGRLKSAEENTEPSPALHSASPVPLEPSHHSAPLVEQASEDFMRIEYRSGSGLDVSERSKEEEEEEQEESVDSLAMAPGQPGTLRKPSMSILPDFLDTPRVQEQGTPRKNWRQTLRNSALKYRVSFFFMLGESVLLQLQAWSPITLN